MMFKNFKNELNKRAGTGYHIANKYDEDAFIKYAAKGIEVNEDYLLFLNEVGYGSFFDGALVFFPLEDDPGSVLGVTARIQIDDVVAIGYDGTTSGFYVLTKDKKDKQVYWLDTDLKTKSVVSTDFVTWIEEAPIQLFNKKIFSGFKKINDLSSVLDVIGERKKFEVTVKSYDKQLVRPAGKENDMLPRYNRVVLSVLKKRDSPLDLLTVILHREGSPIGEDNKEYFTMNVSGLKSGSPNEFECYLFDPFNLPFEKITCRYDPSIDLGSKMRVRFKEIEKYL